MATKTEYHPDGSITRWVATDRIDKLEEEAERCRQRAKIFEESNAYLIRDNAELRLEIIAATGQAQTALEENAKLREAAKAAIKEIDRSRQSFGKHGLIPSASLAVDALAALLGGE